MRHDALVRVQERRLEVKEHRHVNLGGRGDCPIRVFLIWGLALQEVLLPLGQEARVEHVELLPHLLEAHEEAPENLLRHRRPLLENRGGGPDRAQGGGLALRHLAHLDGANLDQLLGELLDQRNHRKRPCLIRVRELHGRSVLLRIVHWHPVARTHPHDLRLDARRRAVEHDRQIRDVAPIHVLVHELVEELEDAFHQLGHADAIELSRHGNEASRGEGPARRQAGILLRQIPRPAELFAFLRDGEDHVFVQAVAVDVPPAVPFGQANPDAIGFLVREGWANPGLRLLLLGQRVFLVVLVLLGSRIPQLRQFVQILQRQPVIDADFLEALDRVEVDLHEARDEGRPERIGRGHGLTILRADRHHDVFELVDDHGRPIVDGGLPGHLDLEHLLAPVINLERHVHGSVRPVPGRGPGEALLVLRGQFRQSADEIRQDLRHVLDDRTGGIDGHPSHVHDGALVLHPRLERDHRPVVHEVLDKGLDLLLAVGFHEELVVDQLRGLVGGILLAHDQRLALHHRPSAQDRVMEARLDAERVGLHHRDVLIRALVPGPRLLLGPSPQFGVAHEAQVHP